MRSKVLIAATALLCGAGLLSPAPGDQPSTHSVHNKSRGLAAPQPPAQIACTVLGCMAVPRECTPVAGKTPSGLPTAYDVIVCPPGVWPLK
jgi:hypothetical protein